MIRRAAQGHRRTPLPLALLILLAATLPWQANPPPAQAQGTTSDKWTRTVVDQGRLFSHTSLAVGPDGKVHIAYGEGQLYYARWDGASWNMEEVDRSGGLHPSIALDAEGRPAISYIAGREVKYAHWGGASWMVTTVAISEEPSFATPFLGGTSLSFDTLGNPAIAYVSGSLYFAWWDGDTWHSSGCVGCVLGLIVQGIVSLAHDSQNNPVIALTVNSPLRGVVLVKGQGTGWVKEVAFEDGPGFNQPDTRFVSLAFGPSGDPGVSYYAHPSGDLLYAEKDGQEWHVETVDTSGVAGKYNSLSFDDSGNPAISYTGDVNGTATLKYARRSSGLWQTETVDTPGTSVGQVGLHTSLRFDASGNPVISYYISTIAIGFLSDRGLKWARWNGTSWLREKLDKSGGVGTDNSLAFDSEDNPAISYFDGINEDLKYVSLSGEGWTAQTVAQEFNVGQHSSLAFDLNGFPGISFLDQSFFNLEYARWNGEAWEVQTVDAPDWVGRWTSLAFDPDGGPAISYHDVSNTNLKYAHWNGGSWDTETVDSPGNVGWWTSLAFAPDGGPAISYYDLTNEDLKYAHWNGASWDVEPVDNPGTVGWYTSLAFDREGNPAISYHDASTDNGALKYAHWDGLSWDIQVVDSIENVGKVGWYTSLAFDSEGNPAISYYDVRYRDLKYAYWNGASWDIETVDSDGDVGSHTSLAFNSAGFAGISYYDTTHGELKYAFSSFGPTVPTAATAVKTTLDTDGAAGVSLSIPQVYDANTQAPLPGVLIGSYEATLQYNGALLQVLEVRHKVPFNDNGATINNPGGTTLFSGVAPSGVPWPVETAFVPLRLTGCTTDSVTLTPNVNWVDDTVGGPTLQVDQPAAKTFLRGDAKADGIVDFGDVLFIADYIVGRRPIGEEANQVNAVNAASVKHDGAFDRITVADLILILQRGVGLRDHCFNLLPQAIPPQR